MKRGQTKTIGRFEIKRCDSPRDARMGPMGGGWQWKIGVLGGRTSWIVELVYLQYRITRLPKRPRGPRPARGWVDEMAAWRPRS